MRAVIIGLVFTAGIASLAWALASDVMAVCGVVERTPVPNEDTPIEELRRWSADL